MPAWSSCPWYCSASTCRTHQEDNRSTRVKSLSEHGPPCQQRQRMNCRQKVLLHNVPGGLASCWSPRVSRSTGTHRLVSSSLCGPLQPPSPEFAADRSLVVCFLPLRCCAATRTPRKTLRPRRGWLSQRSLPAYQPAVKMAQPIACDNNMSRFCCLALRPRKDWSLPRSAPQRRNEKR